MGVTVTAFAAMIGADRSHASRIINGAPCSMDFFRKTASRLASFCTADDLLCQPTEKRLLEIKAAWYANKAAEAAEAAAGQSQAGAA